jgi:hypothetical protein
VTGKLVTVWMRAFPQPESPSILVWKTRYGRSHLVRFNPFYLECNSRPPADSLAERVSALACRDLFRPEGRNVDRRKDSRFCLELSLGALELSRVDGTAGKGSPQANVIRAGVIWRSVMGKRRNDNNLGSQRQQANWRVGWLGRGAWVKEGNPSSREGSSAGRRRP